MRKLYAWLIMSMMSLCVPSFAEAHTTTKLSLSQHDYNSFYTWIPVGLLNSRWIQMGKPYRIVLHGAQYHTNGEALSSFSAGIVLDCGNGRAALVHFAVSEQPDVPEQMRKKFLARGLIPTTNVREAFSFITNSVSAEENLTMVTGTVLTEICVKDQTKKELYISVVLWESVENPGNHGISYRIRSAKEFNALK